jgi:hypothetical protein
MTGETQVGAVLDNKILDNKTLTNAFGSSIMLCSIFKYQSCNLVLLILISMISMRWKALYISMLLVVLDRRYSTNVSQEKQRESNVDT